MIHVDGLVKRYSKAKQNAVDGISFDVDPGQFFALLGPNGAGKTTTINILTTILAPSGGTATIDGHDVGREASTVRRSVGIIFQKPSLDRNLTAEENVRLHAILYGLYPYAPAYRLMPAAYKRQVAELASMLGLEKEIFEPIRSFSGGMARKLEIVRSLIHSPKVLFLDEPTAGLDAPSRRTLWDYLTTIRREHGTTVFLTTHYLEEAEEADCICIIDHGRVAAYGTPAELKAELAREVLIVDAVDRVALRKELARLGLSAGGIGPFEIPLEGSRRHAVLRSIETPLTLVQTRSPSLEDAYLEIVRKPDEASE